MPRRRCCGGNWTVYRRQKGRRWNRWTAVSAASTCGCCKKRLLHQIRCCGDSCCLRKRPAAAGQNWKQSWLCREGRLPFSEAEAEREIAAWREEGFPARHHSGAYRNAHQPAYRVVRKEYARWLPLLAAIDGLLAKQERVIVALEGGSASGKTTLAALLARIYGCTVFHMDDFFLRPEQRTAARLAEPGGNVDRERFAQEILQPLAENRRVRYQRYDCQTGTLLPPVTVEVERLVVVEGAYSMHPELAGAYDLSAFLRIAPELQRQRILKRNGPEMANRFFDTWIPMEQVYFETMDTANRCDLILEVDE